jgi:hypothetical protein
MSRQRSSRLAPISLPTIALTLLAAAPAGAADGYWYGMLGGWSYQARGSVTNGAPLDFQRDLGLHSTDRADYGFGFAPSSRQSGWLPTVDLGYVHIGERGLQQVRTPLVFGLLALDSEVETSTDVDDLQLALRWPWRIGKFRLDSGLNLTRLDGEVIVADADTGQRNRQPVDEIFPSPSLALAWQPLRSLRLSLRGDYISYQGQRAQTLEAGAYWQMLGPIGLELGWRQRRYKVESENEFGPYLLDARLSGVRFGLRFEIPR